MPRNVLALALIDLAGVPIAAPSANASTKPSPTAAEHVYHDLNGRIDTIVDGGPCDVGVESTVVDGLSDPPLILRPGGVGIEQLRACLGWENTQIGYKSVAETESKPKAPGMKYRHYSPKARVILYEAGASKPSVPEILAHLGQGRKMGIIATRSWVPQSIDEPAVNGHSKDSTVEAEQPAIISEWKGFSGMLQALQSTPHPRETIKIQKLLNTDRDVITLEISLGPEVAKVARGIFSALRELDRENVDVILVEGINDQEGDTAAAVMNRLRKAAETEVAT
jgi:L-threonylcarbamoyladenylate synthase